MMQVFKRKPTTTMYPSILTDGELTISSNDVIEELLIEDINLAKMVGFSTSVEKIRNPILAPYKKEVFTDRDAIRERRKLSRESFIKRQTGLSYATYLKALKYVENAGEQMKQSVDITDLPMSLRIFYKTQTISDFQTLHNEQKRGKINAINRWQKIGQDFIDTLQAAQRIKEASGKKGLIADKGRDNKRDVGEKLSNNFSKMTEKNKKKANFEETKDSQEEVKKDIVKPAENIPDIKVEDPAEFVYSAPPPNEYDKEAYDEIIEEAINEEEVVLFDEEDDGEGEGGGGGFENHPMLSEIDDDDVLAEELLKTAHVGLEDKEKREDEGFM